MLEEPAKQAIKKAVAKAKARAREVDGVALAVLSSSSRPQDQQVEAPVGQSSKWRLSGRPFAHSSSQRPVEGSLESAAENSSMIIVFDSF